MLLWCGDGQYYAFEDPAPTYGNTNFTYMLDFMMYEAPVRPTIYHGEVRNGGFSSRIGMRVSVWEAGCPFCLG